MAMTDNTAKKQRGRPFQRGQSGNPAGCRRGSRHKATLAAEVLLDGEADALARKAVELALAGDTTALRLCLERIISPRKDRAVRFALPVIVTNADLGAALGTVLTAVAAGELTPDEGTAIASLIEIKRKAIEIVELEARLTVLEKAKGKGP
jgi:Family of unknown function (DUF5681)